MNDGDNASLAEFLKQFWNVRQQLPGDTDLFGILGICGDDADEFIEQFSARFGVDFTGYLWYFHHRDETFFNPGALFFKRPDQLVPRIPITPDVLLEAIRTKRWSLQYPEHRLPVARWDVIFAIPATALLMFACALCVEAIGSALHH